MFEVLGNNRPIKDSSAKIKIVAILVAAEDRSFEKV
jgi:hypothetical protein